MRAPIAIRLFAVTVLWGATWPATVRASDTTLVAATAVVTLKTDGACDVTMTFDVDLPAPGVVEHRLHVSTGSRTDGLVVTGAAAVAGDAAVVGRTLVQPVRFTASGRQTYEARYSTRGDPVRCALLVPLVPTNGLDRTVHVTVALEPGQRRVPGEFPALAWSGDEGRATLGHVPAFVLVRRQPTTAPVTWAWTADPGRLVDISAVVILVGASVVWAMVRRRTT